MMGPNMMTGMMAIRVDHDAVKAGSVKEGIDGPQGAGWGASTINRNAARGTGILNNELSI